jgi:hypothetical protein
VTALRHTCRDLLCLGVDFAPVTWVWGVSVRESKVRHVVKLVVLPIFRYGCGIAWMLGCLDAWVCAVQRLEQSARIANTTEYDTIL